MTYFPDRESDWAMITPEERPSWRHWSARWAATSMKWRRVAAPVNEVGKWRSVQNNVIDFLGGDGRVTSEGLAIHHQQTLAPKEAHVRGQLWRIQTLP